MIRSTRSGQYGRDAARAPTSIPLRALLDVLVVDPAFADRDVEHAVRQSEVGAGHRLEVQGRAGGGRRCAAGRRRCAGRPGPGPRRRTAWPAAWWQRGCEPTSRIVSASARSASGNGSPRSMPNARLRRGGRGRHAEPPVVVDHAGAQGNAGELAERVRLLVGQTAAAEAADRVGPVALLGVPDAGDDRAERLVPGSRAERAGAVAGDRSQQWAEQALRVVEEVGRVPALRAQTAEVGREVRLRLEGGRPVARGHADAALQRAVRAVRQRRELGCGRPHTTMLLGSRFEDRRAPLTLLHVALTRFSQSGEAPTHPVHTSETRRKRGTPRFVS